MRKKKKKCSSRHSFITFFGTYFFQFSMCDFSSRYFYYCRYCIAPNSTASTDDDDDDTICRAVNRNRVVIYLYFCFSLVLSHWPRQARLPDEIETANGGGGLRRRRPRPGSGRGRAAGRRHVQGIKRPADETSTGRRDERVVTENKRTHVRFGTARSRSRRETH